MKYLERPLPPQYAITHAVKEEIKEINNIAKDTLRVTGFNAFDCAVSIWNAANGKLSFCWNVSTLTLDAKLNEEIKNREQLSQNKATPFPAIEITFYGAFESLAAHIALKFRDAPIISYPEPYNLRPPQNFNVTLDRIPQEITPRSNVNIQR